MKRRTILLLGIWISFIFVTCCFVIPFHQFIHAIQGLSDSHEFKVELWAILVGKAVFLS